MKVGTIIAGKFRIERVIGRGAMGVVVESTDITLNRRVAVKLILPQWAEDAQLRGRFIREAHVMTRLQTEHVAQVLEVGELEDGMLFMAMEFLEGQSLEEMISSAGSLPVADAVDLVLEALDAISEAHGLGLVHRDLKPSNLFLAARRGKPPILKVLDFGIVKDLGSHAKLTATGTLPGTPAYMAPEQIALQEELIDARADIWAIGVTLYELLTGELPFQGSINVMLAKIRSEAPPRLRGRRPDVAPELEAIVSRCLSKHPSDRFAHAGELAMALSDLRMRGLVRSERGAERTAVETEVSINRQRMARQTAETEADPSQSQPGAMRGLLANANAPPPTAANGRGRILPILMIVVTICILVGLILAFQGRLSPLMGTGGDEGSSTSKSAITAAPSGAPPPATQTSSAIPNASVSPAPTASAGRPTTPTAVPALAASVGTGAGKRRARFISARNTGDRAWRAWIERHRSRLDGCTAQQTCPINVSVRLTKSEARVQQGAGAEGCTLHGSMAECLNETLREPGTPGPDVCTPDDCHADVQVMFD